MIPCSFVFVLSSPRRTDRLQDPQNLLSKGTGVLSRGYGGRGVELTIDFFKLVFRAS